MRYAWIELNSSDPNEIEFVAKGCELYHSLHITPIVTTVPGHTEIYNKLPSYVLPGLKTAGLLTPFDSLDGWKALAAEVAKLPGSVCILEHETALKPYWAGEKTMKQSALHAGLEEMPNKQYWWYPQFFSDNAPGRWTAANRLQKTMTKTIQAAWDTVRFVDGQFCYPEPEWDSDIQQSRGANTLHPTLHIWYPKETWEKGWPKERYKEVVDKMEAEPRNKDWIFYPGYDNWRLLSYSLGYKLGLIDPPHATASSG